MSFISESTSNILVGTAASLEENKITICFSVESGGTLVTDPTSDKLQFLDVHITPHQAIQLYEQLERVLDSLIGEGE